MARRAAPDAKVWAIVKANAYGHGIERVFDGLRGVDGFALLDLQEAQRVRALGWRGPILLLEGAFELRDLELCSRLDPEHLLLRGADRHAGRPKPMCPSSRQVLENELRHEPAGLHAQRRHRSAWTRLNALPQVDEISRWTHFSDADGPKGIAAQMATFADATCDGPAQPEQQRRHTAPCGCCGSVRRRPGIAMYGSAPDFPQHTAAHGACSPP